MNKYKAILSADYFDNPTAAIRYSANPKKVVKMLDGLDVGVAIGKPHQLAELLMVDHHDPEGWQKAKSKKKPGKRIRGVAHAGRSFIISVQTPADPTPEVLTNIDRCLEQAFFDFKKKWVSRPWGGFTATLKRGTSTC